MRRDSVYGKLEYLIENSTYKNNELYDFEDIGINEALFHWHKSLLTEQQCRELARTEPWKSLWNIYEKSGAKLFFNKDDEDITYNQTNTMWSQMYDNIQESMDCPTKEVIEDDDMLDGWFIVQAEKREQEKAENEFDNNTNEKVNSDEVFVMTKNEKDIHRVENMNSLDSKMVKKQRAAVMKKKGSAQQQDFRDEILKQKNKQMEAFKENLEEDKMDKGKTDYKQTRDSKYKVASKKRLSKILKRKFKLL